MKKKTLILAQEQNVKITFKDGSYFRELYVVADCRWLGFGVGLRVELSCQRLCLSDVFFCQKNFTFFFLNFDNKDGKYSIEHCMVCQINENLLVEDEKFSESERLASWCMAWQVDEDLEDLKEVSVVPIQVVCTNINTFP